MIYVFYATTLIVAAVELVLGATMIWSTGEQWRRWPILSRILLGTFFLCEAATRSVRAWHRIRQPGSWMQDWAFPGSLIELTALVAIVWIFVRFRKGTLIQ